MQYGLQKNGLHDTFVSSPLYLNILYSKAGYQNAWSI